MRYYDESVSAALAAAGSSREGLSNGEAQIRLGRNGKNKLAREKKDSIL